MAPPTVNSDYCIDNYADNTDFSRTKVPRDEQDVQSNFKISAESGQYSCGIFIESILFISHT